jgi:mRNA interferase HigB
MRVLAVSALRVFWVDEPQAEVPLRAWYSALEANSPQSFSEMKAMFNSVDLVPDKTDTLPWHVFDVSGNKYRVICKVSYQTQYALIKHVLDHKGYDRWTEANR